MKPVVTMPVVILAIVTIILAIVSFQQAGQIATLKTDMGTIFAAHNKLLRELGKL